MTDSRIQQAIMEATGYSLRGDKAEAAARAVARLILDTVLVTDDDLMLLEAVIGVYGDGCGCDECEAAREVLDRIGDAVEAVQELARETEETHTEGGGT